MLHGALIPQLGKKRWEINAAWQTCWPLCRQEPSSNAGAGGYAGRDEITSDSTCIYGGPHGPSRPLRRGRIIRECNVLSGLDFRNQPPRSFTVLERSIDRAGRDRGRKFKPVVLGEIQAA